MQEEEEEEKEEEEEEEGACPPRCQRHREECGQDDWVDGTGRGGGGMNDPGGPACGGEDGTERSEGR